MTHNESGVVIEEAPNLKLYTSTREWLQLHALPTKVVCEQCKTVMTLVDSADIRYYTDTVIPVARKVDYDRAWAEHYLYPSLYRAPSKADYEHRRDLLVMDCRVCGGLLDVTPNVSRVASDMAPVLAYFENRDRSTRVRTRWWTEPVIRITAAMVFLAVSLVNAIFWSHMLVTVAVVLCLTAWVFAEAMGGRDGR